MGRRKDNNYYDMFVENTTYCVMAAEFLNKRMNDFDITSMPADLIALHEIEHEADVKKHEMSRKLAREFITPIEREDIIALSQQIDTVTDAIEDVLIGMHTFYITEIRSDALEMAELILQSTKKLKIIMDEFANFKKSETLHTDIIELNRIEEIGDSIHQKALHELFKNEKDPVKLFAWAKVYDTLEECLDAAEDVSDVVESVVMKNS